MRFLIVLAVFATVALCPATANLGEQLMTCSKEMEGLCTDKYNYVDKSAPREEGCHAKFCGFPFVEPDLREYVGYQIGASYDYLMLTSYYGNYLKNRPGFEKQFKTLADKAWSNAIDLIKYITKRGGQMVFNGLNNTQTKGAIELSEVYALAFALDTEKELSVKANHIHEKAAHAAHPKHYDAEVSHFIEEKFLTYQADKIRQLAGWATDVKGLLSNKNDGDSSLSLFLFDEYLQKQ